MCGFGRTLLAVAAVVCLLLDEPTQAQRLQSGEFLAFAQELVRASFPELVHARTVLTIKLTTELRRDWYPNGLLDAMEVKQVEYAGNRTNALRYSPLIRALFGAKDGAFDSVTFTGPYVEPVDLQQLTELGHAHPEWTDEEMARAVKNAGAPFAPGEADAFLRAYDLDRFSGVLGVIEHRDAHWFWRGRLADQPISPRWVVDIVVGNDAKADRCYTLAIEPTELRLTSIGARECR